MKTIKRTDYQRPFILLFIMVGLFISALSLGLFFYHEVQLDDKLNRQASQSEFDIKKERFEINFTRFKYMLHSLVNNADFLAYVDDPENPQNYEHVSKIFFAVADTHPSVMQLRYLDVTGKEQIRIDRSELRAKAYAVPKEELQDKSKRYYFTDTIAKKGGELFVSRLDLNIEHDTIEAPYKPVMRIALPVYRQGKSKGILIVNLFISEVLQNLITSSSFDIYLYDHENYILTSNDIHAGMWGRYLGTNQKVNPATFTYSQVLFSSAYESISMGLKPKKKMFLFSIDHQKILLLIFVFIIPISFVMAYFLSRIPKNLFDALEERESLMIQQSKMAAMGEMIGAIAHQWRQPLNGIGVLAQEIEVRHTYGNLEKEELSAIVRDVMNYLEYMSKTIDDFRNFFKPAKEKAAFNVDTAINDSLDIVRKQFELHSIDVDIQKGADDLLSNCAYEADGYENEFKQVIINLLNNAKESIESSRKSGPDKENGKVHILLTRERGNIVIRIRDNGDGIQNGMLERIFDPYVTTKYEQQGTGIGLYLAKLIIERNMQGSISASNTPGGAEFTIILPAAKQ